MRKKHLCGLLAAGLVGMAPVSTWAVPMVRFDIADMDIRVGETFSVDVVVDGVDTLDEVVAFGFDVDFSVPLSEAAAPMVGADFVDDSALFPGTYVAGSIDPFAGPGPSGDGILLATLSFVSSAAGLFDLGIASNLLDPNEGLFTFNSVDSLDLTHSEQVTVNARVTGMPEPETLALFGLGVAGIGFQRRKRRAQARKSEQQERPRPDAGVFLHGCNWRVSGVSKVSGVQRQRCDPDPRL